MLYLPAVILFVYLFVRLIDYSNVLTMFPLDLVNDQASYMAQLFFLKDCGFHNFCPYWYGGFTSFLMTPPGWYFFVYPIYLISNVQASIFYSTLICLAISFAFILGLKMKLWQKLALFGFFFVNPFTIGNYFKQGRAPELLGWALFFILYYFVIYYKDRKMNYWAVATFSLMVAGGILVHQYLAIFSLFLLSGLFLYKNWKERILIFLSCVLGFLLTSWWWYPYILSFSDTLGLVNMFASTLLIFEGTYLYTNLAGIVLSLAVLGLFFLYWKQNKKDLLFYFPFLVLAFVFATRLIYFIPVLRQIYPDVFLMLFIFLIFTLLFKLKNKLLPYALIVLAVLFVVVSHVMVPYFVEPSEMDEEILVYLENMDGSFFIVDSLPGNSYPEAYYSYAPIYLGLSSPDGWYPSMISLDYHERLHESHNYLLEEECGEFLQIIGEYEIDSVITPVKNKGLCNFDYDCGDFVCLVRL